MKKNIWKYAFWILLVVWIVFSIFYVVRDMTTKYQNDVIQASYQKGITDSVNSLITEAKKCEPVTAYNKDESIELIWTDCLKTGGETTTE